jgi:hypothetical protein
VDFAAGIADGAVLEPWRAVQQLAFGRKPEQESGLFGADNDSLAAGAGRTVGFAADMALLSILLKKPMSAALDVAAIPEESALANIARLGTSGAVYGFAFTPSDPARGLLSERLKNGAVMGGSFAAI